MKAGDTVEIPIRVTDFGGDGVRYANAAAFVADYGSVYYELDGVETALTYTLTPQPEGDTWQATTAYSLGDRVIPSAPGNFWYECTSAGTSAGSEPTWPTTAGNTVVDSGATWTCRVIRGDHLLGFTLVAGFVYLNIRPPSDRYIQNDQWSGDVPNYDQDAIAALQLTSVATPGVIAAQDVDLGTITAGDAYRSEVLTVPEGIASQIWGVTDLTGYTLTVALKFATTDIADVNLPTSDWVSESARTFRIEWDDTDTAVISAINNAIGTTQEVSFFIDVQITGGSPAKTYTPNKYTMSAVWDRNDT